MHESIRNVWRASKDLEAELLRDNARAVVVALQAFLLDPSQRLAADDLLAAAREVFEGAVRLVQLAELLDGLPPRPED